jgi:hypothetical protein
MKFSVICLIVAFTIPNLWSQIPQDNFKPNKILLKKKKWQRVSDYRFEDDYYYFAVEWQQNEYVLMDMGSPNKEYIRATNFDPIFKTLKTLKKNRFTPNDDLQNKTIWKRVALHRFECNYLKLAIEFDDPDYVLYAMNGPKEALFQSVDFALIRQKITNLTLR